MKNLQLIFVMAALLLPFSFMAQTGTLASAKSSLILNQDWEQSANWLMAFRDNFGKEISTNWISELAMDGTIYQNKKTGGFILVLPNYIDTKAKLHAKFEYGIFENKHTRLLPVSGEQAYASDLSTMQFMGTLEGFPATLEMAVAKAGGKYLTIMGFFAGHELTSDFSKSFKQAIERNFGQVTYAHR